MSVPSLKKQCRVHSDGSHSNHVSDLSCNHPQLLKIHQTVHLGVIACKHTGLTDSYYIFKLNSQLLGNRKIKVYVTLVEEGEVFLNDRKQRDDRRLQVVFVEEVAVFGHIARRVENVL